jgi:hypothetical protein
MNGDGKTQVVQLWNNNQQTSSPPPVVPPAPPNPCAADPCSALCEDLYACQCFPNFVPGQISQTSHQLRKTTLD